MNVGFIGLGNIGKPMARRLPRLGGKVVLYDVNPAPLRELAALGCETAASPGALARDCSVIGVCVRDDADVEALLQGPDGLLRNAARDSVIAIHSTVTQDALLRWAAQGEALGLHVIDAPITGGASGAEAGTLTYMVGGSAEVLERCRPVFATSAQKIIHAGAVGRGIALKLCNNIMTYAAFTAIHEAAALAQAGGLEVNLLLEVGRSNGVVTPQMEAFFGGRSKLAAAGEAMLQQAFAPFAALGRKDLAAALASAAALGLELPLTRQLESLMEDVFAGRTRLAGGAR
jgi:3-hydroxyisobutyrate dehydrogenase